MVGRRRLEEEEEEAADVDADARVKKLKCGSFFPFSAGGRDGAVGAMVSSGTGDERGEVGGGGASFSSVRRRRFRVCEGVGLREYVARGGGRLC